MELQTVLFYGKPGSGKGTQSGLFKQYLEAKDPEHPVLYIETGAAFRTFAQQESHTANIVRDTLAHGGLLPEFLPVWVWTGYFIQYMTGNEHVLLDGLARRAEEVPVLYRALQFYKRPSITVIELYVSTEWATARSKERGRADDTDEDIAKRLAWYEENVVPAVGTWRNMTGVTVKQISGEVGKELVHAEILKTLQLS